MNILIGLGAVAAIICAIPLVWRFCANLVRKIKSSRFPIYWSRLREYFFDFCQRVFQPPIKMNPEPSAKDYINSPRGLVIDFNPPVTLPITSGGQTKIYHEVTRIEIRPINPFVVNSIGLLGIDYKKPDYGHISMLYSVSYEEILRLRRQMYYVKVQERNSVKT